MIHPIRSLLFVLLALAMLCGTSPAQLHHRADLENVPIIDVHTHPLRTLGEALSFEDLDKELKGRLGAMDAVNVRKSVLLSHGFETTKAPNLLQVGSERESFYFLKAAPQRFLFFTTVDFTQMNSPDFSAKAVKHLEETVRAGARGMKFELGKPVVHWMPMDDPRLDPVYDKAAELGIPIVFHSSDPEDFFDPPNQFNFWLNAQGGMYSQRLDSTPSREQLHRERMNMFRKHPKTTFILAHFGFLARQLPVLADVFERYPNVHVEMSVTVEDLGRSPKESAAFMKHYSNRIMFGTDSGSTPRGSEASWVNFLNKHFAVFETDQDDLPPPRARAWNVHGLNLPKDVLERIYYKNAEELLARPVTLSSVR